VNERLSDLMHALVQDEPALRTQVDDIVLAGRRGRRRRRWTIAATASLAVAAVIAVVLVVPSAGGGDRSMVRIATPPGPTDARPTGSATGPFPSVSGSATSPATHPATPLPSRSGSTGPSPGAGTPAASSSGTAPAQAPAAGNGLADPGFEAAKLGWSVFGHGPVLTRVTGARSGSYALQITSTDPYPATAGGTSNPVQVTTTAGTGYTATCWVRSDTKIEAAVQVQEYTTSWVRAGNAAKSPLIWLTDPGRWYELSVTYTAAQDANLLPLTVFSPELGAPNGTALIVDDCSLSG
jgi:Carbohydrate binding domain